MTEILVTSSFLILSLLLLRRVFWRAISRRLQYALWGLVLLRLLIPWNLPPMSFSVLSAAAPVLEELERMEPATVDRLPQGFSPVPEADRDPDMDSAVVTAPEGNAAADAPVAVPQTGGTTEPAQQTVNAGTASLSFLERLDLAVLLPRVYVAGAVLVAGVMILGNLRLWLRLRKERRPSSGSPAGRLPVWVVSGTDLPAPCVFALGIYLTNDVDRDPVRRAHVLAHEQTHLRHLDPLWALLRCLCLALWWFNPLVWVAASCSLTDCELACDEAVTARMEGDEDLAYGETLVSLIPRRSRKRLLSAAAGVRADRKVMRERISRIVRRPRQTIAAVLVVAILTGILAACSFGGSQSGSASSSGAASGSGAGSQTGTPAGTATEPLSGNDPAVDDLVFSFQPTVHLSEEAIAENPGFRVRQIPEGTIPYPGREPMEGDQYYVKSGNAIRYDVFKKVYPEFCCSVEGCSHNSESCPAYFTGLVDFEYFHGYWFCLCWDKEAGNYWLVRTIPETGERTVITTWTPEKEGTFYHIRMEGLESGCLWFSVFLYEGVYDPTSRIGRELTEVLESRMDCVEAETGEQTSYSWDPDQYKVLAFMPGEKALVARSLVELKPGTVFEAEVTSNWEIDDIVEGRMELGTYDFHTEEFSLVAGEEDGYTMQMEQTFLSPRYGNLYLYRCNNFLYLFDLQTGESQKAVAVKANIHEYGIVDNKIYCVTHELFPQHWEVWYAPLEGGEAVHMPNKGITEYVVSDLRMESEHYLCDTHYCLTKEEYFEMYG